MRVASIETNYEHIELNDEGIPIISDANMKVVELVLSKISYAWSPEELHFQYPHLTMGQIHSALAYYCSVKLILTGHKELGKNALSRLCGMQKTASLNFCTPLRTFMG